MKYIRTKDGRLISEKEWKELLDYAESNCQNIDDMILRQSDTIEELCDCFVYGKCDYMELEEAQQEKEWYEQNLQQGEQPIYGAIWTDKGLIYVARMNDNGELELL